MPFLTLLRVLLLALIFSAGETALAQNSEVELKAAFIFTLTRYVEWSGERLPEGTPLQICFAGGASPLSNAIQPLTGRAVRGHTVEIITGVTGAAQRACHVLVNPPLPIKSPPVPGQLTMSEQAGAASEGCHIELFFDKSRVGFDANLTAARQSGLQLSAQLLKLARQVR